MYVPALTCMYFPYLELIASSKAAKKVHVLVYIHTCTCIHNFTFHSHFIQSVCKNPGMFHLYYMYTPYLLSSGIFNVLVYVYRTNVFVVGVSAESTASRSSYAGEWSSQGLVA